MRTTVALVTGSNRGVGRALVEALLDRGVPKVYAAARDLSTLEPVVELDRSRVVPLRIDLREPAQIEAAAEAASDAQLLVNNAGILQFGPALECERENVLAHLMTNTIGTLDMIRAFTPVLERNGGGRILNVMSLQSFAGSSGLDGYSASKAALNSLTQSLRPALRERGISISGAFPGGVDTDMLKGLAAPKSSARAVAEGTLDGLAAGEEDIYPDPVAQLLAEIWQKDPKRYERLFGRTDELVAVLEGARSEGRLQLT
jgi:NAD(P)-dependent dehydrogenase (short-subunit alcohol dehydrogenase family)